MNRNGDIAMSNVSAAHGVEIFDSKSSKALPGQVLVKWTPKGENRAKAGGISKCVSVPPCFVVSAEELGNWLPYVQQLAQNSRDALIKTRLAAGAMVVEDSEISQTAVLTWLESQQELSAGLIGPWLETSGLVDALRVRFAEVLGISGEPTSEQEVLVEKNVSGYVTKFLELGKEKVHFEAGMREKLLRALQIAQELADVSLDDGIGARISQKLAEMAEREQDSLVAL